MRADIKSLSKRIFRMVLAVSWSAFLLFLPVTSFPFIPGVAGGSTLVRPLSVYPLVILISLFTLPRLFRKPVPKTLQTLIPFIVVVLISTLLSSLQGIYPQMGVTVPARAFRTLLTLGIGGAIYATVALWPRDKDDLKSALRWIYLGFSASLLWGSLQAVYIINFSRPYFNLLQTMQSYIAVRRLFTTRISGMTYEPNWFAEQITFLLLPWLLSAVITGYSVFKWRKHWLTIEMLLLGWAAVVLVFTFSRAGLLNLAIILVLGLIFLRPRSTKEKSARGIRIGLRRISEALLAIIIMSVFVFSIGTRNEFFSRIWNYWLEKPKPNLSGYFEYLGFGARLIYSQAAYDVFTEHPWTGVGLGNFAFYFEESLPDRPLPVIPEVMRVVTPTEGRSSMITPKNFYTRLLAETGLLGMATFTAFIVAIFGCGLALYVAKDRETLFWGAGGLLGVAAFLLSGLTFDSFALPNMWVVFGITTAASSIFLTRDQYQVNDRMKANHQTQITVSNTHDLQVGNAKIK